MKVNCRVYQKSIGLLLIELVYNKKKCMIDRYILILLSTGTEREGTYTHLNQLILLTMADKHFIYEDICIVGNN